MNDSRLRILGIPIDSYTFELWLDQVGRWVRETRLGGLRHICTVNPEFVMIAQSNLPFYRVLQKADLCVADGSGILLAAKWLRRPLPQRITGTDSLPRLVEQSARDEWRLFFLGAGPEVAELAAEKLREAYPGAQIIVNGGNPTLHEAPAIIEHINESRAEILLVAYGAPTQDLWIDQYRDQLPYVKVAMGVGGAFDFVASIVPRAPKWMRQFYLEWLYRLVQQPSRWRRMLRLPMFVLAVLWYGSKPTPPLKRRLDGSST